MRMTSSIVNWRNSVRVLNSTMQAGLRAALICFFVVCAGLGISFGQASGNVGYSQSGGSRRAEQVERAKRVLTKEEMPPSGTSMFVEASVLMNVNADEYVAVFGVSEECVTVPECNQKMNSTVDGF